MVMRSAAQHGSGLLDLLIEQMRTVDRLLAGRHAAARRAADAAGRARKCQGSERVYGALSAQ